MSNFNLNGKKLLESIRDDAGQGLLEFAVSIVFLLLILAGTVDLGRAFFTFMALRDAAQEGAVYGSFCPHKPSEIEDRVRDSSSNPVNLADTSAVAVQCSYVMSDGSEMGCSSSSGVLEPGEGIKVRVTFSQFRLIMPFMGGIAGSQTIPISADVTDTVLALECNK